MKDVYKVKKQEKKQPVGHDIVSDLKPDFRLNNNNTNKKGFAPRGTTLNRSLFIFFFFHEEEE